MKRGEIWTVAGGPDDAGKPRPAVILQDAAFDMTHSVTVCPLTSHLGEFRVTRPLVAPTIENGLKTSSHLMVDKVTTVTRLKVQRRIGRLSRADVIAMNRSVFVFLGLGSS